MSTVKSSDIFEGRDGKEHEGSLWAMSAVLVQGPSPRG